MTLYTDMKALADELVADFGFSTYVRRVTSGAIDPVTGANTEATTDYAVDAVATGIDLFQIDGTVILAGDKFYTLTNAAVIQQGDKLLIGGEYLRIVKWIERQVQSGIVAYSVQVRK